MDRKSETALIKRILANDQQACAQLVREYYALVYQLLVNLTCDFHQAEDLVQETFTTAWRKLDAFNGASSLATWLHKIAYRKFLDTQRRQTHPIHLVSHDELDIVDASTKVPLEDAALGEDSKILFAAVDKLNPAERHVVLMYYLHELNFRQIAEVVGTSAGTIRWRHGRALENLRGLLQEPFKHATK